MAKFKDPDADKYAAAAKAAAAARGETYIPPGSTSANARTIPPAGPPVQAPAARPYGNDNITTVAPRPPRPSSPQPPDNYRSGPYIPYTGPTFTPEQIAELRQRQTMPPGGPSNLTGPGPSPYNRPMPPLDGPPGQIQPRPQPNPNWTPQGPPTHGRDFSAPPGGPWGPTAPPGQAPPPAPNAGPAPMLVAPTEDAYHQYLNARIAAARASQQGSAPGVAEPVGGSLPPGGGGQMTTNPNDPAPPGMRWAPPAGEIQRYYMPGQVRPPTIFHLEPDLSKPRSPGPGQLIGPNGPTSMRPMPGQGSAPGVAVGPGDMPQRPPSQMPTHGRTFDLPGGWPPGLPRPGTPAPNSGPTTSPWPQPQPPRLDYQPPPGSNVGYTQPGSVPSGWKQFGDTPPSPSVGYTRGGPMQQPGQAYGGFAQPGQMQQPGQAYGGFAQPRPPVNAGQIMQNFMRAMSPRADANMLGTTREMLNGTLSAVGVPPQDAWQSLRAQYPTGINPGMIWGGRF